MAKFSGNIGFASYEETRPGIWEPVLTERHYRGDIIKDIRRWPLGDSINGEVTVSNQISIIADNFANENFNNIRYVTWKKINWVVKDVETKSPRLILTLGGEYKDEQH